jgi:UDP-glucose 4-epimerase
VHRLFPQYAALYGARGWRMFDAIERVYVNAAARRDLGWAPRHDFAFALEQLANGDEWRSELALAVGAKGYHAEPTGIYTTR